MRRMRRTTFPTCQLSTVRIRRVEAIFDAQRLGWVEMMYLARVRFTLKPNSEVGWGARPPSGAFFRALAEKT